MTWLLSISLIKFDSVLLLRSPLLADIPYEMGSRGATIHVPSA